MKTKILSMCLYMCAIATPTYAQNVAIGEQEPVYSGTSFTFTQCSHTSDLTSTDGFCTCSRCSATYEPETLTTVTLTDDPINFAYQRTTPATVTGELTYSREFSPDEMDHWQPLYMPLSARYTADDAAQYDIAEIYTYGVVEDTNGDGVVNALDKKKMMIRQLDPGENIVANTPYLIKPRTGIITFTSCDGKLSAATAESVDCGTMMLTFTFTGNYKASPQVSNFYVLTTNDGSDVINLVTSDQETSAIAPFRWYMTVPNFSTNDLPIPLYVMSAQRQPNINGDEEIDEDDVSALSDIIINGTNLKDAPASADVNRDGKITIADIVTLIDYISEP